MALKKTCRCGSVIDYAQTMCSKCDSENVEIKKESRKQYDIHKRNAKSKQFYNSRDWHIVSEVVRVKSDGMCAKCWDNEEVIISADVVHHIVEILEDWDKRLDIDNLICLCHGCHNEIHSEMSKSEADRQRVILQLKSILKHWSNNY